MFPINLTSMTPIPKTRVTRRNEALGPLNCAQGLLRPLPLIQVILAAMMNSAHKNASENLKNVPFLS